MTKLSEIQPDAPHATDDDINCWDEQSQSFVSWSTWIARNSTLPTIPRVPMRGGAG